MLYILAGVISLLIGTSRLNNTIGIIKAAGDRIIWNKLLLNKMLVPTLISIALFVAGIINLTSNQV